MTAHEKIISRRLSNSMLLMVGVAIFIFDGFLYMLKTLTWHPILGVKDWLRTLFGWRSLLCHLLLFISLRIFATFHSLFYSVQQHTCSTRQEAIRRICSIQRIFHCMVLSVLGCLNVFIFVWYIKGAASVAKEHSVLEMIFHLQGAGDYSFLLFSGLFSGALFTWKYYSKDLYLLRFTLLPQPKLIALKSRLPEVFRESIVDVFKSLHICYISYVLFGPFVTNWFISLFTMNPSSLQVSVYNMINLKLLLAAVIASVLLHIMWHTFIEIVNVCLTERYEFQITETADMKESSVLLSEALHCAKSEVQYLAYLDLRHLAQFSQPRRAVFFSITKPGGHPKHWLFLSSLLIRHLTIFLDRIEKLVVYEKSSAIKMPIKKALDCREQTVNTPLCLDADLLYNYLAEKPLYKYFTKTLPDSKAIQLFTTCQLEIWTIEALGFFLAAAYTEDRLGVVQQTLPTLMSLIINIKMCEEKLPITVMSFKKYAKDSAFLHKAIAQRQTLKSALESAIYRIVLAFKTDIRGISLSEDHQQCLEKYLEFKR